MTNFSKLAMAVALLSTVCAAQSFSAPARYNLHEKAGDFVLADVSHDGFADVLALQSNAHSVAVLLNDHNGALHQVGLYDAGLDVRGIAVADFNRDGKLDIVVGNQASKTVSVLLGNGDGTFQARKSYAVDGAPNSIVVGDFNNDGKTDIAALGDNAKITILTNTGTSFTSSSFTPPQFYAGSTNYLFSLTAGDFNGDGRMDLAYADQCGSSDCGPVTLDTYYALFNTTNGWQGHVASHGQSGTIALHAADVDNDGKSDLVSSYFGCGQAACSGNVVDYSNGDGTFQQVDVISESGSGGDPSDAVVADFNNDGINDIASPVRGGYDVAGAPVPTGIVVYTSKGGRAGFNKPVYFASGGANSSFHIDAGFLRAQSRKDVVVEDSDANNMLVFRNTASVAAEPCPYPVSPAVHYCGPANGSSVIGPVVKFLATARAFSGPVKRLELWVDGHKLFQTFNDRLNRTQTLSKGTHTATVVEVDSAGGVIKSTKPKFTVN